MKALVLTQAKSPLEYLERPDPIPTISEGEVLVKLSHAALNRRDYYITRGLYPGVEPPIILGSDGAGTTEDGRDVIINPSMHWGPDPRVQQRNFEIVGMPSDGTFAEQIAVNNSQLAEKPSHLSFAEAAALPLAGLTAYRALMTKCQVRKGERVLVTGAGGGVAQFATQFAQAAGAEVWVTSSSDSKIEQAVSLGANGGANYTYEGWANMLKRDAGYFDVIIDSAGGSGFKDLIGLAAPAARICFYGGTRGKIDGLSPQIIFWKQLTIMGSTMGTADEFAAMIRFVKEHGIRPQIDRVVPLIDGGAAVESMGTSSQFGKIVLEM